LKRSRADHKMGRLVEHGRSRHLKNFGSLTTEYPANGSFFRPQVSPSFVKERGGQLVSPKPARAEADTHAVCKELSREALSHQLTAFSKIC
jgi:hypothetical protein